ncbi:MAG: TetR/AcrR family transcriptional regulator [Bacteroidetes bacterium]|nr:TetR/AcrR family transcriptional regulator [Bacteroidota bacterium]
MTETKRNEIVDQVKKLYLEFGIKSVTMDDVAHKLGISKKTLYEHFTDKKQLVWSVLECLTNTPNSVLTANMPKNMNALEELLHYYSLQLEMIQNHKPGFIYDLKKYYPRFFEHFNKLKRTRFITQVRNNLIKGKAEGLFRSDLDEEIITRLTLMRMECIMTTDIFLDADISNIKIFNEIFRFHLFGIVSEKGRKLLEKNNDKFIA